MTRGHVQAAEHTLAAAIEETLESLDLQPEDAGTAKLATKYARELDKAGAAGAWAEKTLRLLDEDEQPDTYELVSALRTKLAERSALETLGPKLLAALDALGASPKARVQAGKGATKGGKGGRLAELRAARS